MARCFEQEELPNDAHLLRRVRNKADWLTWHADEQRWLPQVRDNNSLKFDPDLSAPWREHLREAHNLGPEAVLDGRAHDLVFQITSQQAVSLGNGTYTEHTPNSALPPPLGCAHSSIWCQARAQMDKGEKRIFDNQLSKKFVLVSGTPPPPQPGA